MSVVKTDRSRTGAITNPQLGGEGVELTDTLVHAMVDGADGRWFSGSGRRRRVLLLFGVFAVVGAGAVAVYLRSDSRAVHAYDRGPLQTFSRTRTGMLADEVGQVFTFGAIVVTNTSKHPVVLEEIRVVPPLNEGMTVVALQVAGADRRYGFVGTDQQFPPPDLAPYLRPPQGAIVPPERAPGGEEGMEIVFGLRIDRPGSFGFREVQIDYRQGKGRHTLRLEDGFVGCAPRAQFPEGCGTAMKAFFESRD